VIWFSLGEAILGEAIMRVQYRIGEFAELAGVSIKTLRFYDEIGLFRPAGVDARTRYRHYLPQQLEQLASIIALKDLGISLSEIRGVLSKASTDRKALLLGAKRSLERSIRTAAQSLQWINASLDEMDPSDSIAIVVKRRPHMRIASIRSKVSGYADIVPLELELLNAVPKQSVGNTRGILWHSCADSGTLEGEPFVALKRGIVASSAYHLGSLPPTALACAYSELDDEKAERTYAALKKWMRLRGYSLVGPKREIYVDGMLEIQFPFEPAEQNPDTPL
jgi:DNA-binding transcriptional MerR regulator